MPTPTNTEDQPFPIGELITQDVEATLARVKVLHGYHVNLSAVERLNEENHHLNVPAHHKAIVVAGAAQLLGEQQEGVNDWLRPYSVITWVFPSETNGVPIDQAIDMAGADILRALCRDDDGSNRRGGWAVDTRIGEVPIDSEGPDPETSAYLVVVNVESHYQTQSRNPYRRG